MSSATSPTTTRRLGERTGYISSHVTLADVTLQRLNEFRRRRDLLSMVRGAAIVTLVGVSTMLLATLSDRLIVSEWTRWGGAVAFYVSTVALFALLCIRPKQLPINLEHEARRLEQIDARLTERLLPAVELANAPAVNDSIAFRAQVQTQAAKLLETVDVRQLLTWSSIQRFLFAAAISSFVFTVLCVVPGLNMPHRIARILLPAANLGRVSSINIELEQPTPHSLVVPRDDLIAVVARVVGPLAGDVELETRSSHQHQFQTLRPRGIHSQAIDADLNSMRYEGVIAAVDDWTEYRVLAGGSQTRWHKIVAKYRPEVKKFYKTVHLPVYAAQQPYQIVEEHGDIEVMEGGRVHLELELNMPIAQAHLQWIHPVSGNARQADDAGHAGDSLPLLLDEKSGRLVADFEVQRSGEYRIHLVSLADGFTNAFGSTYRVLAAPDVAPKLTWRKPNGTNIIAGREQLLELQLSIQDEFPVANLVQRLRRNGEAWMDTEIPPLKSKSEAESEPTSELVDWNLDFLALACEPGDVFDLQASATDRHGQRGESTIIRITVTATTIDLPESTSARLRQELARGLTEGAEKLATTVSDFKEIKPNLTEQSDESTVAMTSEKVLETTRGFVAEMRARSSELSRQVEQTLAETNDAVSELELRTVGGLLSQLESEQARQIDQRIGELVEFQSKNSPVGDVNEQLSALIANVDETLQTFEQLAEDVRTMVSHDVVTQRAEQFSRLATAQRQLEQAVTARSLSPEQLERQQLVIGSQLSQMQDILRKSIPTVSTRVAERFKQVADELNWMIEQTDRLDGNSDSTQLQTTASSLASSLEALPMMNRLAGDLPHAHMEALRRTQQRAGTAASPLNRWVDQNRDDLALALLDSAIEQLSIRRTLQRTGSNGALQLASELGDAKRAVKQVAENVSLSRSEAFSKVENIANAVEILSAASSVESAKNLLSELARVENWASQSYKARMTHPRMWEAYGQQLENSVREMRNSSLPREIADQLEQMQWNSAAQQAGQKLSERYWSEQALVTAAPDVKELLLHLSEVQSKLTEHVNQARQSLSETAPTISELANDAADATQKVVQQTEQLAIDVDNDEVPNTQARLENIEHEVEKLDSPVNELREALVDRADAQNLLDKNQLQLAQQSDAAIAIVDQAQQQTKRSLEQVAANTDEPQSAQSARLQNAAAEQADAAEAFDQLARNFEPSNSMSNASGELAAAQDTTNLQQYAQADRLAKMADAKLSDILRQLEQQLQVNPAMQRELSAISRTAVTQALESLEHATDQQTSLPRELEASDPVLKAKQDLIWHDLQNMRELAGHLTESLVAQAARTSESGKQTVPARQIAEVQERIQLALDQAEMLDRDTSFHDMRETANGLQDTLNAAAPLLEQKSRDLAKADAIHKNEADLNNRRREMRDLQRRLQQQRARQAIENEKRILQRIRQLDEQRKHEEQQAKQIEKELQQTQTELERAPDQQWLKDQAKELEQRISQANATKVAQQELREELDQRLEIAQQRSESVNLEQQVLLDSKNPSAELAAKLSANAANRSRELANDLQSWSDPTPVTSQANRQQLHDAIQQEQGIGHETSAAAESLARAARHEQRLKNSELHDQLDWLATSTATIEPSEIKAASQSLLTANSQASLASTGQATADATNASLNALTQAAVALSRSADAVRDFLQNNPESRQQAASGRSNPAASQPTNSQALSQSGQPSAQSSSQPSAQSSAATPPGSQTGSAESNNPLTSEQMAQLLDELDAQQNAASKLGQQDNNATGAPSPSGQPTPSTLTEAAKRLAASLSRRRQPPSANANSDQGMATESSVSNVNPHAPAQVKILDIDRIDGDWGKLREQSAEEVTDTRREALSPHIRRQVDAYFRSLSERSEQEATKP